MGVYINEAVSHSASQNLPLAMKLFRAIVSFLKFPRRELLEAREWLNLIK